MDRGVRKIQMGKGFFTGYRKNTIEHDETLVSIFLQKTRPNQYIYAYKQAKRRDDDIAIVNGAFNVEFEENSNIVKSASFAFGGMAPMTILAENSADYFVGKKWNESTVATVIEMLDNEMPLKPDAPGGMVLYRRSLAGSLLFKAFLKIYDRLSQTLPNHHPQLQENEKSGHEVFHTLTPQSTQIFEKTSTTNEDSNILGRPRVHVSAFKQVTGEAIYIDDIIRHENELYLGFVLSTKAHAKILEIDPSAALKEPGVHAFFSATDIGDRTRNMVGPVWHDEFVFVDGVVTSQGQAIGVIVSLQIKII